MKQEQRSVNFCGLSLKDGEYTTPVFDTRDEGCTYNRLVAQGSFEGARLVIIVAASDNKKSLDTAYFVRAVNTGDILLHSLSGRYVRVQVSLTPNGEGGCELTGLRLELPRYSFVEYLPEIYWGNSFFERYIAIFQSMLMDLEQQVDRIPQILDYRTTPDENVELLAGWVGLENLKGLFSPSQLRHLIEHIDIYQGAKGTKHALIRITKLLTGITPRIIEYFEWARPGLSNARLQANRELYGETPNHFCVIMDLTKSPLTVNEKDLEQLIESYSPLDSHFKVVYLAVCSLLDVHCYLDINSALSTPELASVGGGAFGGEILIG